jgi:hypothetical protein
MSLSRHARACTKPRRTACAGFALAVLLVAAQALGLCHRTSHVPATPSAALLGGGAGVVVPAESDHASFGVRIFGHGAGESAACRLFDQQTLADVLLAVAVVLPVLARVVAGPVPVVERVARCAPAPYQARAPPGVG